MGDRGRFITLEGGEGVGKSTNLAFVAERLRAVGLEVVTTREPGGTPLAETVRALLLDATAQPMTELTELLLVFAARAEHLGQVVRPALARGAWIVCDRFTDATYAYQGGGRGLDAGLIAALEVMVQQGLQPDLTLYLDMPLEHAEQRLGDRERDRFEREEIQFFQRVREVYLARAADASSRFRIIDASAPLETVQEQIDLVLGTYLKTVSRAGR